METLGSHQPILQWILKFLQSGIQLDQHLIEFAETNYGHVDISALLEQGDSSEAASFLDLVLQPSLSHRLEYESKFGRLKIDAQTVSALLKAIESEETNAAILIPGTIGPLFIKVPTEALVAFVHRLNITWSPPDGLADILSTGVDEVNRPYIRANLRQTRVVWHSRQIELVSQFLSRFPATSDDFHDCFAFILSVLDELAGNENLLAFLTAKKRFFYNALTKAIAFERRRSAGNMEILMMQGERAAHGSIDHWRSQMYRVDLICQSLFGYTPHLDQPITQHYEVQSNPDSLPVDEVMRILD